MSDIENSDTDNSEDTRPPSARGTPESAAWFRTELEYLGMNQTAFARWLKRRGDDRKPATILRHVQRMATGEARVSGEMRVVLHMMRAGQKKAEKQAQRRAAENQATAGDQRPCEL